MTWEIKRIDENDKEDLNYWLENGWQPFSVTSEVRAMRPYDNYRVITHDERVTVNVIWLRKHMSRSKMFAIWTEHLEQNFEPNTIISSEIKEVKAGMTLVSCGDEPTYWKLHSVYDTLEDANAAHQDPHFLTAEPL